MVKEIFMITAYCPDLKKQDILRNLVNQLLELKKDIMIISHNHIPDDILKRVNYYFYDEQNKTQLDSRFRWKYHNYTQKYNFNSSILFPSYSTFLPVLRLSWFGYKICKFLGYNVVHKIEYDVVINNFKEFDNNSLLLQNKNDCIIYDNIRHEESYKMQGSYVAINPQNIPDDFFIYDEVNLLKQFQNYSLKVENFVYDYYYSKLKHIKKSNVELQKSLKLDLNNNDTSKNNNKLFFTLFHNPDINPNEEWFWYVYCPDDNNDWIPFNIIINNQIIPLSVKKWAMGGISNQNPLENIQFMYNNKIESSFNLTDPQIVNMIKKYNVLTKK
jgi:hypothetical protein